MNEVVKVGFGKATKVFTFLKWLSDVAGKVTIGQLKHLTDIMTRNDCPK